jgi:hypothetical protein
MKPEAIPVLIKSDKCCLSPFGKLRAGRADAGFAGGITVWEYGSEGVWGVKQCMSAEVLPLTWGDDRAEVYCTSALQHLSTSALQHFRTD